MNESQNNYAQKKKKKPLDEEWTLYNVIFLKFWKIQSNLY